MAMRGEFLYTAYMPGKGPVEVFQDMDSTTHVFAMQRNGQSIYTTRDAVRPRKVSNRANRVRPDNNKKPEPVLAPTLF